MKKCIYYYNTSEGTSFGIGDDYQKLFDFFNEYEIRYSYSIDKNGEIDGIAVLGCYDDDDDLFISTLDCVEDLYNVNEDCIFKIYCDFKDLSIEDFFGEPPAEIRSHHEMCEEIWNELLFEERKYKIEKINSKLSNKD